MQNSTQHIYKNNLFTELLISNKNNSLLETIQIHTMEQNSNPNLNPNPNQNPNQEQNITIEEIFNKYNKLKNKINLFWNKVE